MKPSSPPASSLPAVSLSNRLIWLLAASVAMNAVLVGLYVVQSFSSDDPSSSASLTAVGSHSSKPSTAEATQAALLEKVWRELQSGDPATLAARLQAAGLRPATIRAVLEAQNANPLASTDERLAPLSPAERAARAQARTDARPLSDYERNQYGDLTRDKIRQVQKINADYGDLTREIRDKAPGTLIPEDREKLAFLEKEKLADLAKILTPQEFEDYQLRTSNTAASLRYLRDQAVGFRASDDEFRALYRATSAADAQYGATVKLNAANPAALAQQKQAAIDAQLQAVLSPERFADYKRATDPAYQPVNRLVTRLDLPATTSDQVVALQTDLKQRAAAIRSNTKAPVPLRNEQLAALAQEADAKFSATLTPRGYDAYRADGGLGNWMKTLAPLPPPPPPKPKS